EDFQWQVTPSDLNLEAEFLGRMMIAFGTPEQRAAASIAAVKAGTDRALIEKSKEGASQLVVDDAFDRAWRRVGLALDRTGFTVVDRDRSTGIYFVRFADPDAAMTRKDRSESWLAKLMFWKTDDEKDKPEQYRIK